MPGFHSCTSPRQESVLTDAVACPCAFRGRWKNPGKVDTADASDCTLDQGGNSSRTRTEDQQLEMGNFVHGESFQKDTNFRKDFGNDDTDVRL